MLLYVFWGLFAVAVAVVVHGRVRKRSLILAGSLVEPNAQTIPFCVQLEISTRNTMKFRCMRLKSARIRRMWFAHYYSDMITVFFLHFLWLLTLIRNCLHPFEKYVKSISIRNNLHAQDTIFLS